MGEPDAGAPAASEPVAAAPEAEPQTASGETTIPTATSTAAAPPPAGEASSPASRHADALRRSAAEEKSVFDDFVATVLPLLRTPIVVASAVAAGVATVLSFAFAVGITFLFIVLLEEHFELGGFGISLTDEELVPTFFNVDMLLHQVPFAADGGSISFGPMLFVVLPLLATLLGIEAARRLQPDLVAGASRAFVLAFAGLYGLGAFIISFVGPEAGGERLQGAHLRAFLYAAAIAWIGSWLHRRVVRGPRGLDDGHMVPGRLRSIVGRAARVLGFGVVLSTLIGLAGQLMETLSGAGEKLGGVLYAFIYAIDTGIELFASGTFARGVAIGEMFETEENAFVWERYSHYDTIAQVIMVIAAFLPVLLAGIYSGFAIARDQRRSARNDRVMFGALGTGAAWAVLLSIALYVAQLRAVDDEDALMNVSGVETFFFALLVGTVLGLIGAVLAVSATTTDAAPLE